jgi:O-succinylbenzoate synthase
VKIEAITLREIRMRLQAPFETSFGVMQDRRILLVEALADGVSGWGEVTAMETPSYNSETTDTAWHVISDFIAPSVVGRTIDRASDFPVLTAHVRGHQMAKAGVENALWDCEARQKGVPLYQLLGGSRNEIVCGVSLGICANPASLVARVEEELDDGYHRIKLKIKPGKDVEFVRAVRKSFPKTVLSVDANSAYRIEDAMHLKRLDEFGLLMIEQPLYWNEIHEHARLQGFLDTALCLDECIDNARDAATAIEVGACRIINIKLGRVGGHTEARRVHDICSTHGIPVWCGGMLESGIGRAHNIAMSTLPGFTLPGDVSASRRYWRDDIIEPGVTVTAQGTIEVPESPGLGYATRSKLIDGLTARSSSWKASTTLPTS